MSFIKDTFLGGAEEQAAAEQVRAGRTGQGFIRDATTGARGELETGFGGAEDAITQALQQALGIQGSGLQDIISALTGGAGSAISTLQGGQEQGIQALQQALSGATGQLDPFATGGQNAFQQQLALSGSLGPEAQAQAFADFKDSPGQDFLRESGERSISRQASASGGLGGGALLADLQQFGTGVAAQDFNNQFNRLGQLAGRGQQAATQIGQFGIGTGRDIASLIGRTQGGIAGLESGLGQQLAQALGISTQQISNLISGGGANVANLRTGLGSNLAQLLLGEGVNLANLEQGIGAAQAQGTLGSVGAVRGTLGDLFGLGQSPEGNFDIATLGQAFGIGG